MSKIESNQKTFYYGPLHLPANEEDQNHTITQNFSIATLALKVPGQKMLGSIGRFINGFRPSICLAAG